MNLAAMHVCSDATDSIIVVTKGKKKEYFGPEGGILNNLWRWKLQGFFSMFQEIIRIELCMSWQGGHYCSQIIKLGLKN